MKRSAALLLLACCAALACRKEPPPAAPAQEVEIPAQYRNRGPEPDVDSDNLLNLGHGESVISRTGELNLESSA